MMILPLLSQMLSIRTKSSWHFSSGNLDTVRRAEERSSLSAKEGGEEREHPFVYWRQATHSVARVSRGEGLLLAEKPDLFPNSSDFGIRHLL
jgi:hypothetical protein